MDLEVRMSSGLQETVHLIRVKLAVLENLEQEFGPYHLPRMNRYYVLSPVLMQ